MTKWLVRFVGLAVIGMLGSANVALADPSSSANYTLDESFVGGGGLVQSNSANYQVGESVGGAAVGQTGSANYQAQAGFPTTGDPSLSFAVNTSLADFGSFSAAAASTATATFSVSNYTSYGYVVQIVGEPPTKGSHTISAMSSTAPSQAGTEQFGINLAANTSPVSFGANPDHGSFGFGSATANYGTANNFRYVSGETIASAPKSSGVTTYTISYIVNVSSLTPGGQYTGHQELVCTGTY